LGRRAIKVIEFENVFGNSGLFKNRVGYFKKESNLDCLLIGSYELSFERVILKMN
jgi:hypothetical protein